MSECNPAPAAATVSSIEAADVVIETQVEGKITRSTATRINKIKWHSKNAALDMAMRHQGLYERENTQHSENLELQVVLVGKP